MKKLPTCHGKHGRQTLTAILKETLLERQVNIFVCCSFTETSTEIDAPVSIRLKLRSTAPFAKSKMNNAKGYSQISDEN
jgi:hypothetical protein